MTSKATDKIIELLRIKIAFYEGSKHYCNYLAVISWYPKNSWLRVREFKYFPHKDDINQYQQAVLWLESRKKELTKQLRNGGAIIDIDIKAGLPSTLIDYMFTKPDNWLEGHMVISQEL